MQYVIENPTWSYGREFIRSMHRRFGARAVCFYTRDDTVPHSAKLTPELFSDQYVAASYRVAPNALPAFIEHLRRHHPIQAVIPPGELQVLNAITIAESLGLDWVQPEIMRRFRDKNALKAHLRATDPGLRINHAELVSSPTEALAVVRRKNLTRFVLKPNDGCANVGIGIFSAHDAPSLIDDYWRRTQAGTVLLEEFISGREYHCNGQVDAEGNITFIDIGRTHYTETEQREIVCLRTDQIPSNWPVFTQITDYIRRMIVASGLRRSPFHAELRVDETGPSLLECAARLIGGSWSRFASMMHGSGFDMVDLAAHYYATPKPYGEIGLNWQTHDESMLIKFRGVALRTENIRQLEGVKETEKLPQFVQWTDKPAIGQHVPVTNSLMSSPYSLMTRCRTLEEADELERTIRRLIKWNERSPSLLERGAYVAARGPAYLRRKLKLGPRKGLRMNEPSFASDKPS